MRVSSDDAAIFYEVMGDGPALVLLHPFPAHREIWVPVAETLAHRYRVLLPDLRGHGASSAGEGPATMQKHVRDVLRVCDDAGVGRAAFAGISIGGYILFELWRQARERIAALALCCTRAGADSEEGRANRRRSIEEVHAHGPEPFVENMITKLFGPSTLRDRPDLVEAARKMMRQMRVAGIAAVLEGMALRPDSTPTLGTITVPTLVLAGEEDALIPRADAELMHHGIAGSEMHVIGRAGHYAVFEQAEAAAKLLRNFLDALTWH